MCRLCAGTGTFFLVFWVSLLPPDCCLSLLFAEKKEKIFPLRWKKNFFLLSLKKKVENIYCTYILWKIFFPSLPFQDVNSGKWRLSILYFLIKKCSVREKKIQKYHPSFFWQKLALFQLSFSPLRSQFYFFCILGCIYVSL